MYKLLHFDHIISNKQAVYKYTNRLHVLKNNKLKKKTVKFNKYSIFKKCSKIKSIKN